MIYDTTYQNGDVRWCKLWEAWEWWRARIVDLYDLLMWSEAFRGSPHHNSAHPAMIQTPITIGTEGVRELGIGMRRVPVAGPKIYTYYIYIYMCVCMCMKSMYVYIYIYVHIISWSLQRERCMVRGYRGMERLVCRTSEHGWLQLWK